MNSNGYITTIIFDMSHVEDELFDVFDTVDSIQK